MQNNYDSDSGGPDSGGHTGRSKSVLLELKNLCKSFPGVQALDNASFDLSAGEIHALVGENGAGKSTLIKILTGVHRPDSGEISFDGKRVEFHSPLHAQAARVVAIYQEFTLIPTLSVRDNLFLGRELTHLGFIDTALETKMAFDLLAKLGVTLDINARVSELSIAQQQLVEIARALGCDARILVMDEPTAALSTREIDTLFRILRDQAKQRVGIIFVSHRLDEVFAIADRITVMRDGRTVDTRNTSEYSRRLVIEQMVGRSVDEEIPKRKVAPHAVGFEVRGLSGGTIQDVSFGVQRGEVLGIAGLMGSGRTELVRLIFGADRKRSGEMFLDGRKLDIRTPRDAIDRGICLLTEDRKVHGLVLKASVRDNFSLPSLRKLSKWSWILGGKENDRLLHRTNELRIRFGDALQSVENLSGGNQQKLLVARWLETNSQVILFDEPTRGIDVGAKYEIYLLINRLASEGRVVIVVSSELPELIGLCDRILVMRRSRIAGEISDVRHARQEDIMSLAV